MSDRQAYALAHPLNEALVRRGVLDPYTRTRRHATGLTILTVLAIDR